MELSAKLLVIHTFAYKRHCSILNSESKNAYTILVQISWFWKKMFGSRKYKKFSTLTNDRKVQIFWYISETVGPTLRIILKTIEWFFCIFFLLLLLWIDNILRWWSRSNCFKLDDILKRNSDVALTTNIINDIPLPQLTPVNPSQRIINAATSIIITGSRLLQSISSNPHHR